MEKTEKGVKHLVSSRFSCFLFSGNRKSWNLLHMAFHASFQPYPQEYFWNEELYIPRSPILPIPTRGLSRREAKGVGAIKECQTREGEGVGNIFSSPSQDPPREDTRGRTKSDNHPRSTPV